MTHSIHNLLTIGNGTGLEFNYEGNTYKVESIDDNKDCLKSILEDNLPIAIVDLHDDGKAFMRSVHNANKTSIHCSFYVHLNDDYMIATERREQKSLSSIETLQDEILQAIRKVSIKHIGVHLVANWEDGGSDADVLPIHSAVEMLQEFPTADRDQVQAFFAGIQDGIQVRTWIDEHNRLVCDTIYYQLEEISENQNEVSILLEDDLHSVQLLMSVQKIFS